MSLGSTVFEVLCLVSSLLSILNDDQYDQYGRQSLLSTYVQFQCKIPHPFQSKQRLTCSRSTTDDLPLTETYSLYDNVLTSGRSLDRKGKCIYKFYKVK